MELDPVFPPFSKKKRSLTSRDASPYPERERAPSRDTREHRAGGGVGELLLAGVVRFCMAAVEMEKEDPEQVHAAQILASLRNRKLRRWPEWVPMQQQQQPGEASSSSPPGTVAVAANVMLPSGEASTSAGTVAARVPLRRRPPERVVSMVQSAGEASFSLAGAVAAGLPEWWPKNKRSGCRAETSREPEQGHAAAKEGSGGSSCEAERSAEVPAASAQGPQPVVAALCYDAVAVSGSGPSTTSAAPANKEPMKTPSPNSPLDCGAGGSGAPSSADDAAPAPVRPQAKRKGTDAARGSVGGGDEGCSSPAKRAPVAPEEEKPTPISGEPSVQSETRAPRPFDLNLLPCPMDEDDDGCPDST